MREVPINRQEPGIPCLCPVCHADLGPVRGAGIQLTKITEHVEESHPDYCTCGDPLSEHKICTGCGITISPKHLQQDWGTRKDDGGKDQVLCSKCLPLYDIDPHRYQRAMIWYREG